jgi:PAS domain S-box-containing protein
MTSEQFDSHAQTDGLRKQVNQQPVEIGLPMQRPVQNYEALVNSINGILWEADARSLRFTFVSPQAERILGYPVNEWLEPDFWLSHIYSGDREKVVNTTYNATRKKRNHELQYRMVAADGRLVWLRDHVTIIENDGAILLRGILTDISQQKPVEDNSHLPLEEELIATISHDSRQSPDLKQILSTAVSEARQFLQTDRMVVFRFRPDWSGAIVVESVEQGWKSILGEVVHDPCFQASFAELYQQGGVQATSDINTPSLPVCFVKVLQGFQVRASLTVPIKQQGSLWGLLIAHHCRNERQWQSFEIDVVKQLAGQVGVAIEQSELYLQVQRLNEDLERQVQIRTAELQLASEFEATLKRITDRVRDSLDEDQILQTAVRELAIAIGVTGCNASIYDLENRTSKVSYEYTDSMPLQGRVVQMDNFPEGYHQLLQGYHFQFCSLIPNPLRGHVAMLACPILDDQGGVLGDLWLVSQKYRAFNEQDIRLVKQVANQCAIAIRQARLYQKAQAQVEELEKLNRLKDDFLSAVSHELRTPMSNIKLATQMLETILFRGVLKEENQGPKNQPDTPPPKGKSDKSAVQPTSITIHPPAFEKASRYFKILKDECEREINLINDLLDLSRLETGIDIPMLEAIELQVWLPKLIQPFLERARSQRQTLDVAIPADLPVFMTDASHLQRILTELLNNACKYTSAEQKILVTVNLLGSKTSAFPMSALQMPAQEKSALGAQIADISCPMPHLRSLQITVSNSGVEISADELTRIFDKFYRIPNNDPWKHGGTGLGLALVKKLVEPLGGNIQAVSQNGITSFIVELPFAEAVGTYVQSPISQRGI